MLVSPRPGVHRKHLLDTLQRVHNAAFNLRGGGGPSTAHKYLLAYLDWASDAARMLGYQISLTDLGRLVLTERYKLLLSMAGTMASTEMEVQRVVNGLVSLELDERVKAFDEAIKAITSLIDRWFRVGDFVMPDTSFYIRHECKLKEADIAAVSESWEDHIHLLVPMVIVDELDALKESKDRHVRWRAGHTLGVLDEVFANTTDVGHLPVSGIEAAPDGSQQDKVTIELVFDPPGHTRLPINDDEIIDRALAVQALADRNVTLLTYDTGQATRARNAGLQVVKLSKLVEDEPA